MVNIKVYFNLIFLFFILIIPQFIIADSVSLSSVINVSAQVLNQSSGSSGSQLGIKIPTSINFSGKTHKGALVFLLKDGEIVATTISNSSGNFSVNLFNSQTNIYTFSLYSQNIEGNKSSFFSFPIYITAGTNVNISNIYLSPIINVDKNQVEKGNNLIIYGQSIPNSQISILLNNKTENLYQTYANNDGSFIYNLITTNLNIGLYQITSKLFYNNQYSPFSLNIPFVLGNNNQDKDQVEKSCLTIRGDLNCDGRVNLIDFSIMIFWYKKPNPKPLVDLNSDGIVNLVDFSIMASNWTG
jgi:hypothetical protein